MGIGPGRSWRGRWHTRRGPVFYNTGASYMLSAIIQRVTGQTLLEYLRPRLLEPLGIEGATWQTCPRGVNTGGFGLNIKTEDIARFGQLYLQRGVWQERRLLPEAWVADASAAQVSNAANTEVDWQQGYGYQFWRCRHGAYHGDGAFGQFCVILPDQDAVVAITAGSPNMQAVLNLIWTHLLSALPASGGRRARVSRMLPHKRHWPARSAAWPSLPRKDSRLRPLRRRCRANDITSPGNGPRCRRSHSILVAMRTSAPCRTPAASTG